MFSSSNLKRTPYTKNGLSNLVTATPLSPPMSEMGVRRDKAAFVAAGVNPRFFGGTNGWVRTHGS
jgi:hypothetical protein